MVRILCFIVLLCNAVFGVTDMLGRDVDIKNSQKLVFIGPGALRLGVYLGLENRIVGIEARELADNNLAPYNDVIKIKNLHKKPIIGEGGPGKLPSMEALIESNADLIIASFMSKENIKLIEEKTKIPVFSISYGVDYGGNLEKMESIKKSLLLLGDITGVNDRAAKLVNFMDNQEMELKNLNLEKKSVYIGGVGYKGSWGIGSTEGDYLPFYLLGIKNDLVESNSGHIFIDIEKILSVDPDVIFLDLGGEKIVKDEMENKKDFFHSLKAFKNNQIFWVLPFNFYNTNIENSYFIAWNVAKVLGVDVDLNKKKNEIYKEFLGLDR